MKFSDRIKSAQGRKIVSVPVPQWGFDVLVRSWSALERADIARRFQSLKDSAEPGEFFRLIADVCVLSLVEEDCSPCFGPDAVDALLEKDYLALEHVFKETLKHNGLGEAAVVDAKKN